MIHDSLLIIVPAYNEGKVIKKTLQDLKKELKKLKNYQSQILVVDDGSHDHTLQEVKKVKGIKVVSHRLNRGLGGALGTGLEYAKRNKFDFALTFDSDGQHFPQDIPVALKTLRPTRHPARQPLAEAVEGSLANASSDIRQGFLHVSRNDNFNVGIGSRLLQKNQIPFDRQIIIRLSNLLTWLLFGIHSSDTLSGFRVFDQKAIQAINLRTERMEVSNEFFAEINRHQLKLCHFPINIRYTAYSRAKGQTNLNSFRIFYKLVLRLFR